MATTTPPKAAPLGRSRNPYELLKDADRGSRALVMANHRERIRALAWAMTPAAHTPPEHAQADFLAIKHGCCTVLSLVSLIAAEVTANDYPHDLPFHPDATELADAISRNHLAALQIVKDRIRTGALPVRPASGVQTGCNADPAVLTWCNDPESIRPPQILRATLADACALVQAIGLNPLRELAGESAPPTDQTPPRTADLEEPAPPLPEPANTSAPSREQQGKELFSRLLKEGRSSREAVKQVHAEFGERGLSRTSLRRSLEASHPKPPTPLGQLLGANARK